MGSGIRTCANAKARWCRRPYTACPRRLTLMVPVSVRPSVRPTKMDGGSMDASQRRAGACECRLTLRRGPAQVPLPTGCCATRRAYIRRPAVYLAGAAPGCVLQVVFERVARRAQDGERRRWIVQQRLHKPEHCLPAVSPVRRWLLVLVSSHSQPSKHRLVVGPALSGPKFHGRHDFIRICESAASAAAPSLARCGHTRVSAQSSEAQSCGVRAASAKSAWSCK